MNVEDFGRACERLTHEGFAVRKAEYDDHAFGSWFIDFSVGKGRMRRMLWEGKDGWLLLQAQRENAWEDQWIARDREQQTLERAISQIQADAAAH